MFDDGGGLRQTLARVYLCLILRQCLFLRRARDTEHCFLEQEGAGVGAGEGVGVGRRRRDVWCLFGCLVLGYRRARPRRG
jgi:hypothetical protein